MIEEANKDELSKKKKKRIKCIAQGPYSITTYNGKEFLTEPRYMHIYVYIYSLQPHEL